MAGLLRVMAGDQTHEGRTRDRAEAKPGLRGRDRGVMEWWSNGDRKSTRLNSSHTVHSYAVFCLKKRSHALSAGGKRRRIRPVPQQPIWQSLTVERAPQIHDKNAEGGAPDRHTPQRSPHLPPTRP